MRRRFPGLAMAAAAALAGAAGCAHAGQATAPPADARAGAREPVRYVVVTGSRIPRRVEPGSSIALGDAPLRIYSRDAILGTGRDGNLGAALRQLDPDVTIHH